MVGPQNTYGLAGMILGIVSIPLQLCCQFLGLPVAIAAVVLSIIGMNKAKAGLATNRAQAIAGLACGAVAIAISVIVLIVALVHGVWNLRTYQDF
ncbi:DUF4190 domain-containing protein [Krasilnikovia sp. MM14-A1259]|uniref:DUF4190 domain-containing protein n=1 Tax=Krasilnikovia sp. MM14-A1259 TaxID=3373539 RepID=UPI00399CD10A